MPEIYSAPRFAFTGFDASKQQFLRLFRQLTTGKKECFAVGIDWMKPYWLAAEIRGDEISIKKLSNIADINNYYLNADAVLIDIPVGLPENTVENAARPDREARGRLPMGRKSTIFPVPCRQAVNINAYTEASRATQSKHSLNRINLPMQPLPVSIFPSAILLRFVLFHPANHPLFSTF